VTLIKRTFVLIRRAGKLLRGPKSHPVSIEKALSNCEVLEPEDVRPAAAFIRACIRLDPTERATAAELQKHHWIAGADWCRDYPGTKRWAAEVANWHPGKM
jgi:serine/threonine protein kinase